MEIVWSHCNKCTADRKQEILHVEATSWDERLDEETYVSGWDKYEMLKCCGCENVSLRHKSSFSEEYDEHGNPFVAVNYYPPLIDRREPSWLYKLSSKNRFIYELFKEIYIALPNNSVRLATMGLRALIEHVMIDKVGDNGSFSNNLDQFQKKGFISQIQSAVLEPVLEAGHAAMHRSFVPSTSDLLAIIDITENIVESIYINEHRVKHLLEKIPPKPTRKPKA